MFHKIITFLISLLFCLSECRAENFRQFRFLKGPIQGQITTTGFLEESPARSVIGCARTCAENENCAALYYLKDSMDCKIHDQKMSELNDTLVLNPDVVYYEIDRMDPPLNEHNACPVDDSAFRTGETSDGTKFDFRVFKDIPRNHSEAQQNCEAHGANLYKVLTPEKMNFTLSLMSCAAYDTSQFWINGVYQSGTWQTMDGEPIMMTSVFWAPGRPNNVAIHCVFLSNHVNYYMDDYNCGNEIYYVCEK